VSSAELSNFLNETADGLLKVTELKQLACDKFSGKRITDSMWRAAVRALPADKKRARGDTERTLKARSGR
jgi:hypothetical protein